MYIQHLKNFLTFYLAKYTVNISGIFHEYLLELQMICLKLVHSWPLVYTSQY